MKKSKVCRANLLYRFQPMLTDCQCDELERLEDPKIKVYTGNGKRRHFADRAPCLRMPGPLINAITF